MAMLSDRGRSKAPLKPGAGVLKPGAVKPSGANTFSKAMTAQAPVQRAATQMRAPLTRSAPAPQPSISTGGGGGGYSIDGGLGGSDFGGGSAPAPRPMLDEGAYQAQDSILTAALAALDRALADYTSQADADTQNYDRDYNQGLGNLGWKDLDPGEGVNEGWDWNDVLTSSGRAYQNQSNDFASRGMLQSQGYADALQLLNRSLGDQKTAMETGRKDFQGEMGRKKNEFTNQDTLARQQARAESTGRRAAEYGIV